MAGKEHYSIRVLDENEVQIAVDWAAAEGWNPGLNDAANFYSADSQGFMGGFLDDKLAATISAVRYGESFGFIGFYIVQPEYRGRGLGMRLWKAAMAGLAGRNIGLDGVVAQQERYRQVGFTTAYRNVRYKGRIHSNASSSDDVAPLQAIPFEQVVDYDGKLFFTPRPAFLHPWIHQTKALSLGCVKDGRLRGYGVIRQCEVGCKIGPLFAENETIAEALFLALAAWANGQDLYLDIPLPNEAAGRLVQKYGMSPVFETARMYTGPRPPIDLSKVFGVTSFELG